MTYRKKTITSSALSAVLAAATWAALPGTTANAGTDTFLGEIMAFAGNFCPRGYIAADGQLLAISQNSALFSLFGTIYGGDGRTTFGLPDLRGRAAVSAGSGPGLSPTTIGSRGGSEVLTITLAQMPPHTHSLSDHRHDIAPHSHDADLNASSSGPNTNSPAGAVLSTQPPGRNAYTAGTPSGATMSAGAVVITDNGPDRTLAQAAGVTGPNGGGISGTARSPYTGITYCVALQGIYPSRN